MGDLKDCTSSNVPCEDAAAYRAADNAPSCDASSHFARNSFVNVHDNGPIFLSDIPAVCRSSNDGVLVGIDEAGRGSVLGPLVYGLAFWSVCDEPSIPKQFNDSKQLSEDQRTRLMDVIVDNPAIGFAARVIHASEISRNMLRVRPYNLNQMSFEAVFEMIRCLIGFGVKIRTCYIDTIGNPEHYKQRLRNTFGTGIEFVVESKCDANYAPCSAASVVAKVLRDAMINNWKYSEALLEARQSPDKGFGSGYPSDPVCQAWLERNRDFLFGFSDSVRFSWAPIKKALCGASSSTIVQVEFPVDDDDDHQELQLRKHTLKRQRDNLLGFLKSKRSPFPYFEHKKLKVVSKL